METCIFRIVLHPDIFTVPDLMRSTHKTDGRSGSITIAPSGSSEDKHSAHSAANNNNNTTIPTPQRLLKEGDMIEIRVWDVLAKETKSNASSIMRRRTVEGQPNAVLSGSIQSSVTGGIPVTTTLQTDSAFRLESVRGSGDASIGGTIKSVGSDETEKGALDNGSAAPTISPTADGTVSCGEHTHSINNNDGSPRASPKNNIQILPTPGQNVSSSSPRPSPEADAPPTKTVITGEPQTVPPVVTRSRTGTIEGNSSSLPPKPPIVSRARTAGLPPASDLFASKQRLPNASSLPRPRHFRDISDMTVDTYADLHLATVPSTVGASEEEDDAWLYLSHTHAMRLSFVMLVTEKTLTSLKPSARTQVSLLRPVADLYSLSSFDMVTIHKINKADEDKVLQQVSADFVLVTIKDQFISRGDMHHFVTTLNKRWVYEGQRLFEPTRGIQAHAREIRHKEQHASTGIITDQTKITFRSRSSRYIWLVQISAEMWDYVSPYEQTVDESRCETYFDKWIAFVYRLFEKWKESEVTHSLTIVFFSRTFLGSSPGSFIPTMPQREEDKPSEHYDVYGRRYEDTFKIVVENATMVDWDSLVVKLKAAFLSYPSELGWNISTGEDSRQPSLASQGNVLEATNVCLNLLQFHYYDRDLNRTGNSLVIISAGNGVFEVDKILAAITYQRMMDNGIGSDMLSLALPPLHIAPFFLYINDFQVAEYDNGGDASGVSSQGVRSFIYPPPLAYNFLPTYALDMGGSSLDASIICFV
jgi:hypothetical protein